MSQAHKLGEQQPRKGPVDAQPEGARWARRYARRLELTDLLVVVWAVLGAYLVRVGWEEGAGLKLQPLGLVPGGREYLVISVGLSVAWLIALALHRSRDHRVVGLGPEEYKRVMTASFQLFGVVAIASYVLKLPLARGYVAVAFPIGVVGLLLSRWMWRQWLHATRRGGDWSARVVVVGGADHVRSLVNELDRATYAGYHVVGVCVPPGPADLRDRFGRLPVIGGLHDVAAAVTVARAEAVIVTAAPEFGPTSLRRLAWALEGSGVELIVAPSLIDIAGPRIHSRPVAGLPLLHVEAPQYEGPLRVVKDVFERLAALAGLAVLRFHTRGTSSPRGTSQGEFGEAVNERYDVAAALDLCEAEDLPQLWLLGWSFGTDLALMHGGDPSVVGAVLISPPLRYSAPSDLVAWGASGKPLTALVPEHDDFLRPPEARERFAAVPQAEVVAVEGARHLFVGFTERVLAEVVRRVAPDSYPLPRTWPTA